MRENNAKMPVKTVLNLAQKTPFIEAGFCCCQLAAQNMRSRATTKRHPWLLETSPRYAAYFDAETQSQGNNVLNV